MHAEKIWSGQWCMDEGEGCTSQYPVCHPEISYMLSEVRRLHTSLKCALSSDARLNWIPSSIAAAHSSATLRSSEAISSCWPH